MRPLQRLFFYICWPGLYIYFAVGDRSRVIVRCGDEVLLVKGWWNRLFADDKWALPGGGRQHGESVAQGACRELSEETGLTVEPSELQALGRRRIRDSGIGYRADFFLLDLPSEQLLQPRGETTELNWIKLNAIKQPKADVRQAQQLLSDR